MYSTHIRCKLSVHRYKIIFFIGILLFLQKGISQENNIINLPNFDDTRLHYGLMLGFHYSHFWVQYDDQYSQQSLDTLHSIHHNYFPGFKVGFIGNVKISRYLDFRLIPSVAFFENVLTYRNMNGTSTYAFKDATLIEFPLLLKYKSKRRKNHGMYIIAGITPSIEAVGRSNNTNSSAKLELIKNHWKVELGTGIDIYAQYFKLSIECRYSFGINNMLISNSLSEYNAPLKKLQLHSMGMYLTFEGSPKAKNKKQKKNTIYNSGQKRRK